MSRDTFKKEAKPEFDYATTQLIYPENITNKLLEFINKAVDPKDVYTEEDGSKGKEDKPHITILYGIKEQVPNAEAIKILKNLTNKLENLTVDFKGLGKFETPEFDVLKINVKCDLLNEAFDILNKLYPDNANSFDNYSPHSTIAYLKKGMADKYIEKYGSKFIINNIPLKCLEFAFNDDIHDFDLRGNMKTSSKQISITPDQYALMERIKKQGLTLKQVIDMKISKTYKSLLAKNFIDLRNYKEIVLTGDGIEIMRLIPRWSGKAKDKYGNPVQVWNVVKNSDGSYSNFSHDVTDKDHRKDMVVDMPDEAEKSTMPESRSLKEIQERKEGPTTASVAKVSYVAHVPGHKNSQGESAPWVVKSHETGKILSSHKTKAEAKEHLKQMEYFKHKGSFKAKFLNK